MVRDLNAKIMYRFTVVSLFYQLVPGGRKSTDAHVLYCSIRYSFIRTVAFLYQPNSFSPDPILSFFSTSVVSRFRRSSMYDKSGFAGAAGSA